MAGCSAADPAPADPPPVTITAAPTPEPPPPAAVAAPTSPTMAKSAPTGVRVPSLGVESPLIPLGLTPEGNMELPAGARPAGWYVLGPTPGELGPAVLVSHVDWKGERGVFYDIDSLAPGAEVLVDRQDGTTARFLVERVEQHPKDAVPIDSVYGDIDHAGLRLITCGGEFDRSARSYRSNVVVYARLAP